MLDGREQASLCKECPSSLVKPVFIVVISTQQVERLANAIQVWIGAIDVFIYGMWLEVSIPTVTVLLRIILHYSHCSNIIIGCLTRV